MRPEFQRYSCQMALPGFNEKGQQLLKDAKVLIVGAGGLGCPAALYLVASGVGTVGIADFDIISTSNLHRQVLYTPAETGLKKAFVACKKLQEQNPLVKLVPHDLKITIDNAMSIITQYDIVVDGTDNFDSRYLLNDACVLASKPLVYGAIYQQEGQVAVWNVLNVDGSRSPNYRDLFPEVADTQIPNCAESGVMPTLAGITGCMQGNEVIKYITKTGEVMAGKLWIMDGKTGSSRIVKLGTKTQTDISGLSKTVVDTVISVQDLKKGLERDLFELVDVRSHAEYTLFNIGGIHLPCSDIKSDTAYLKFTRPIVCYCDSGKRSAAITRRVKMRFPQLTIYSLEGGLKAWKKALKPVTPMRSDQTQFS
jgi:molybdopterin/thiamine biosynthesis adenylyltransferase/rhodanese-related sulfurtransferase